MYETVTIPQGKKKRGWWKRQKIPKDRPAEEPAYLDDSRESEDLTTTDESVPSEEVSGGQDKCVSSIFVTSLALLSLGNELAQSAADDADGTSFGKRCQLARH